MHELTFRCAISRRFDIGLSNSCARARRLSYCPVMARRAAKSVDRRVKADRREVLLQVARASVDALELLASELSVLKVTVDLLRDFELARTSTAPPVQRRVASTQIARQLARVRAAQQLSARQQRRVAEQVDRLAAVVAAEGAARKPTRSRSRRSV
jgi:hypothetical protein